MSLAQVRVDGSGGYGPSELPAAASPADCGPTVVSLADIPAQGGDPSWLTLAMFAFILVIAFTAVALAYYVHRRGDR